VLRQPLFYRLGIVPVHDVVQDVRFPFQKFHVNRPVPIVARKLHGKNPERRPMLGEQFSRDFPDNYRFHARIPLPSRSRRPLHRTETTALYSPRLTPRSLALSRISSGALVPKQGTQISNRSPALIRPTKIHIGSVRFSRIAPHESHSVCCTVVTPPPFENSGARQPPASYPRDRIRPPLRVGACRITIPHDPFSFGAARTIPRKQTSTNVLHAYNGHHFGGLQPRSGQEYQSYISSQPSFSDHFH
jgi:hypothetical protein